MGFEPTPLAWAAIALPFEPSSSPGETEGILVQVGNDYCQPIVLLDAVLPSIIDTPHVDMEYGGLDYACAQSLAQRTWL